MATQSKIEWTESTWNPVTGCNKISEGCENCYAERMAKRLQAMGQQNYINGFEVVCHPHMLDAPLKWNKSNMVFVNSMGDVFHEKVPLDFIRQVFGVMNIADQHFYQVLTKRAKRLLELSKMIKWDSHIWMGVTVESKSFKYRIDYLRKTPAKIKFLSLEPLLGSLGELDLSGIDWVIVGGESGPRARAMDADWAREVRDQCIEQNVPFFFKQWGGVQKKKNGRILDGVTWDEMPTHELVAV